jgi:hypothetical protein
LAAIKKQTSFFLDFSLLVLYSIKFDLAVREIIQVPYNPTGSEGEKFRCRYLNINVKGAGASSKNWFSAKRARPARIATAPKFANSCPHVDF